MNVLKIITNKIRNKYLLINGLELTFLVEN